MSCLVLGLNKIFYGIIKASFIMGDGELLQTEKVRSLEKEFNMLLPNIDIRELSRMGRDLGLVSW